MEIMTSFYGPAIRKETMAFLTLDLVTKEKNEISDDELLIAQSRCSKCFAENTFIARPEKVLEFIRACNYALTEEEWLWAFYNAVGEKPVVDYVKEHLEEFLRKRNIKNGT